MSSGEWLAKAQELEKKKGDFEELSGQLSKLTYSFSPIISSYESIGEYLKEVIINGKPMDDGKLKVYAESLTKHKEVVQQLSQECVTKIHQLEAEISTAWSKYRSALAEEKGD